MFRRIEGKGKYYKWELLIQNLGKRATRMRKLDSEGLWREETNKMKGAEMLMIPRKNEMKTLNDRVKKPGPEWTWHCIQKREKYIPDFIVVENGCKKETEEHVWAAYVGTTDHCLTGIDSQPTRVIKH